MMWSLRNWRRRRIQQHDSLPEPAWRDAVASLPLLGSLSDDELKRLHEKELVAAGG
ncbi:MAG: hypothetical protein ACYCTY_06840 [Sulfuricella sp.]